jgi:hypothetical protein
MHIPSAGSIDTFVVATAMAFAGCPVAYRCWAIIGFTVFDTLAGLAGSRWALSIPPVPAVLLAVALAVPAFCLARRRPVFYMTLPLLFSVDNLLLGAGDSLSPWAAALDGLESGALACCAFLAVAVALRWRALARFSTFAKGETA